MECASPAGVTLWLASVVLELVTAKEVHAHSQPFVRRAALIASSQACHRLSDRLPSDYRTSVCITTWLCCTAHDASVFLVSLQGNLNVAPAV